jgi:hypothetical protein
MPTATETPKAEQVAVTFFSRCPDQVLVLRPQQKVSNGAGGFEILTREAFIQREEDVNRQRVKNGEKEIPIDDTPWKVQFENSMFTTDDLRVIEKLRKHPTFKTPGPSGFDEEPPPAEDPVAAMADPMKLIARSSVERNKVQLEAIREVELERDNPRPTIIEAVDTALEMIVEESSEPEAAAETEIGDHGGSNGSDSTP